MPYPLRQLTGLMLLLLTFVSRLPAAESIPVFNQIHSATNMGRHPSEHNMLLAPQQAYLGEAPYLDSKIIQHVHYGNRYDNAFYEDGQLYYGDGDYIFYPMTSLDVVSHEIAHGYTANYGRGPERLLVQGQARARPGPSMSPFRICRAQPPSFS